MKFNEKDYKKMWKDQPAESFTYYDKLSFATLTHPLTAFAFSPPVTRGFYIRF